MGNKLVFKFELNDITKIKNNQFPQQRILWSIKFAQLLSDDIQKTSCTTIMQ